MLVLLLTLFIGMAYFWHFGILGVFRDVAYAWQALAFLDGRLDVTPYLPPELLAHPMDLTFRDGLYYWPLKPLPAILVVPLVAFGIVDWAQPIVKILALLAIAIGSYLLARSRGFPPMPAAWLMLALLFGSTLIGPLWLSGPWYLANVLSLAFGIWAMWEYYGRNRAWLIGLMIGCTWATRPTAGLALAIFFGSETLWRWHLQGFSYVWRRTLVMGLPVAITLLLLMGFDALRFGSLFDNGYGDSVLAGDQTERNRLEHGIFSVFYYLQNIYWYFFSFPQWIDGRVVVSSAGLSLFIVSPATFWLFFRSCWNSDRALAWLTIALLLPILLAFYGTGGYTYGPRYLCDLLPFWFILLMETFRIKPMSLTFKVLLIFSIQLNGFLLVALLSPFFN